MRKSSILKNINQNILIISIKTILIFKFIKNMNNLNILLDLKKTSLIEACIRDIIILIIYLK